MPILLTLYNRSWHLTAGRRTDKVEGDRRELIVKQTLSPPAVADPGLVRLQIVTKPITRLRKRVKQGDVGLSKATLAFCGPDADAIIHRYFAEETDARYMIEIMMEEIFGCPR